VIFGGYTILDFNRLRRTGAERAVPIAASATRHRNGHGGDRRVALIEDFVCHPA
jgi:hypothetical protein